MNSKKLRLNFLFLCDHILIEENKKISVIGIFNIINLKEVPGTYVKFVLVGNFSILDKKVKDLNVKVNLVDPNGKPVALPVPLIKLPAAPKGKKLKDVNFYLEFNNLKFESEGEYKFEMLVNKEFLGTYKFQVKHKK